MLLTSETMDEYTTEYAASCDDGPSAPDAQPVRGDGVTAVAIVVLIAEGDLRVDPLDWF